MLQRITTTSLSSLAVLLLTTLPAAGQEEVSDDDLLSIARGASDTSVISDRTVETLSRELEKALGLLGSETVAPSGEDGLLPAVSALAVKYEAIRTSELMGRWLGTLEEATLAWLAFPSAEHTADTLIGLRSQLSEAKDGVASLAAVDELARTGEERHDVVRNATEVLDALRMAHEEHLGREAFVVRYETEWTSVPDEQRVMFEREPTLAVALKARLGRILAEAHARQQVELERLEEQYAQGLAAGMAESKQAENNLRLEQRRELSRLTRSVIEAEYRIDVETELDRQQRAEAAARKLAAERSERSAQLRLNLEEAKRRVAALEEQVSLYEREEDINRLPPEVYGRIQLLAAPGYWRPHFTSASRMDPGARYEGLEPVPHSYSALVAAGCLDETQEGLWALAMILSTSSDTSRPRMKVAGWPNGHSWDSARVGRYLQDSESARRILRELQSVLRKYGRDLVALGHLRQ